ncbi:unnamed protein product [Periconia digitata]|uniref:Uncharacterized protein n=1 Tax=Periconia digitata TaxID=1303443 RepID=A0A9W4U9V8_9PLEO|nr:unnamed protein product [Periconia digitata]
MLDFAVRRGLEHAGGLHVLKRAISNEHDKVSGEFPVWGIILLVLTAIAFFVFLIVVEYALQYLIATLAAIETPNAAITISAPKEAATGEEKEGLLETSPEATLVHEKPITSSIRATLKHLRAESGRRAHLKGFGYHFLYSMVVSQVTNLFFLIVPANLFTAVVGAAVAGAVCAPLHAAWTNKVISKHSNVTFWQRIPNRSSWKIVALPAAVVALVPYLQIALIFVFAQFLNLPTVGEQSRSTVTLAGVAWHLFKFIALVFAVAATTLFLYIPAMATLVRTEASLLSEDQDTVVPFDRTFAGKVVPKSLGGTGVVRFVDAWKSFDGEGRRRVFKHFVKSFFVEIFMVIVIFHVFLLELLVIMGTSFGPAVKQAVGHN